MKKLLVILGPTATGKTDLALRLASLAQGELVSVDSRQVYVGLNIGTGKLPSSGRWKIARLAKRETGKWIVNGIPIHMYDVVSPKIQYSVADYVKDANHVIKEILERGNLPIVVGGTGLYLKALLEGLPNLETPVDGLLRKKLENLSKEELQRELQKVFTQKWNSLNRSDRENPRRLIRAIELGLSPRRSPYGHLRGVSSSYDVLRIGLTAPREVLYKRVDDHVQKRIKQGMIEEAKKLHSGGLSLKRMRQLGLEYGLLADYLSHKITTTSELTKILQNKIHGYVRRQLTWFKKEKNVSWFDITDENYPKNVEKLTLKWYHLANEQKKD